MTSSRQSPRMSALSAGFALVPLFDAQPNSFAWISGTDFAPSQSH